MKMNYLENTKAVGTKVIQIVASVVTKATKALASYVGEALSACEARKSSADIQARGELHNLERRALREMPTIELTNAQVPIAYQWCRNTVALNEPQAEFVFQHMLRQHALDTDSKRELAEAVTPLVGIPNMMHWVCHAHKILADTIIIPVINERKQENNIPCIDYQNIVESPLYYGHNQGITLQYNVHSVTDAEKVKQRYDRGGQYIEQTREILKNVGVQIDRIESKGILLRIHLKWA